MKIGVVQPDLDSLGLQNVVGWSNRDIEPDATFFDSKKLYIPV